MQDKHSATENCISDYSDFLKKISGKRYKRKIEKSRIEQHKRGTCAKILKKQAKKDIYSIDNVVITGFSAPEVKSPPKQHYQNIIVPEYKIINNTQHLLPEVEEEKSIEEDSESCYTEIHKSYEMAEMCGYFLNAGQGLPEALKDGLKVKLIVPERIKEFHI